MAPYGSRQQVERAIQAHRTALMERAHVIGMAPGKKRSRGQPVDHPGHALVVFVSNKVPLMTLAEEDRVPDDVGGITTDVVPMDPPVIQHTRRHRPAPGGVSVGHYAISAGTLGAVVRDLTTGEKMILSNNHVLANSNDAREGDPIYQPGPHDGGGSSDRIARLGRFVPITMLGGSGCWIALAAAAGLNWLAGLLGRRTRLAVYPLPRESDGNLVDAALAVPISQDDVVEDTLGLGPIVGSLEPLLGDKCVKSGRTTGVTRDAILYTGAEVEVGFGDGRSAYFVDQVVLGPMSQGGDSGSVICIERDGEYWAVGLLFAGSTTHTIANRIQHVEDLLGVSFGDAWLEDV